jgi:hypothetical protein
VIRPPHDLFGDKSYGYLRPGVETTFYDAKCMEVITRFAIAFGSMRI